MNKPITLPSELRAQSFDLGRMAENLQHNSQEHEDVPPEFLEYWRAITLNKWRILAGGLVAGALGFMVVSYMTPLYRSTATVLIESNRPNIISVEDIQTGVTGGREHFQTQAEMLRSRDVSARVIKKLGLEDHPEFDPRQGGRGLVDRFRGWAGSLGLPIAANETPIAADEAADAISQKFTDRLGVQVVRLSNLIRVSFDSANRDFAAVIANATVEAFVQADMDTQYQKTQTAHQWITDRLAELKSRLDASETALQVFRDQEDMLDSRSTVLSGAGKQFEELTQKLVEARVRRSEAESAYEQVKPGIGKLADSAPGVVRNPLVQKAKEIQAEAERALGNANDRYGPAHPLYIIAANDLANARANTQRQTEVVVSSILKEYNAARATESALEEALGKSKSSIQNLNRKEIQLGPLEREVAVNRTLYQTFLARSKEIRVAIAGQTASARLVDVAVPARLPVKPDKLIIVGLAAFAGLLIACGAALLFHRLNNTLNRVEDVERKLRRPLLAALPVLKGKEALQSARLLVNQPQHVYSEAIRTASTGILLSSFDSPRKVVGVTSSVSGEGKSTFAMNFSFSQAKSKSVVLVEADMRRPTFAQSLGLLATNPGLAELVAGDAGLEEALLDLDGSKLKIIVAGHPPPNPLELLTSKQFGDLVSILLERFDMVVIDCPPVQLVSDALIVGRQVTGMVYVVKAGETPVPLAQAGLQRITASGVPLFGIVLNQHDFARAERYHGEYSGFGKYGYEKAYGVSSAR